MVVNEKVATSNLPLVVAGQKGIVEEKDLRIPNMRGIMMARKKPLSVSLKLQEFKCTQQLQKHLKNQHQKVHVKLVEADNVR